MFDKIIIGIDGFGRGRTLAGTVKALAPTATRVLVNVYPHPEGADRDVPASYDEFLHGDAIAMLQQERLTSGLPDAELWAIPDSSGARGLKRAAADAHAGLIVVGPADRSPLGQIVLGEVSRGVFHGAPCPVLVVPQNAHPERMHVIGVAYDGSPESTRALDTAVKIAHDVGGRLEVVEVVEPDLPHQFRGTEYREYVDGVRGREDDRLRALAGGIDVPCQAHAVRGEPREVLSDLSRLADLVVCGSRGHGPAARVAFGSAADDLIHGAQCPVLVVPRGAQLTDAARLNATRRQTAHSHA
ncbi:MAG: universal stress protein [Solirubrobacteraceae bacterium]|nr:universal stress protein [Solirubrobacteraceae bacterium]